MVVDVVLDVVELDELTFAVLVEADDGSVLEVEVASVNLSLLTCCDLGDLELAASESFDSVVLVVFSLLHDDEHNIVLLGGILADEEVVGLHVVMEVVRREGEVLNVVEGDGVALESVGVPLGDEGSGVVTLVVVNVSQD